MIFLSIPISNSLTEETLALLFLVGIKFYYLYLKYNICKQSIDYSCILMKMIYDEKIR